MNKIIKRIGEILLLILALTFVGFIGLVWWLTASPRSLPLLSAYIESSVEDLDANLQVSVDSSLVHWSGFDMPLAVTVANVKILNPAGKIAVTIPAMRLGIAPLRLIFGKLQFDRIDVENAVIAVSGNPENAPAAPENTLAALPFKKIKISSAKIIDRDSLKELAAIRSATFQLNKQELTAEIDGQVGNGALKLSATGNFGGGKQSLSGEFHGINPAELEKISFKTYGLDKIDLPLGGTFVINFGDNLHMHSADVAVHGERPGEISYGSIIPGPVRVAEFYAKFTVSDDFTRFAFNRFFLSGEDGWKITSDNLHVYYPGMQKAEIAGRADFENIGIPALLALWPDTKGLADAKSWVRDSLSVGRVAKGYAEINIKPGDLVPAALPGGDVHAEIAVENMDINYSPNLHHLEAVNGVLKFGGDTMDMEVKNARLQNSELRHAAAVIPDLAADTAAIHVEGEVDGPAADLNEFIAKKSALKITAGHADTAFTLDLPLLKDLKTEDVKITAQAKMDGLAVPDIYENTNLSAGNIEFSYSPEKLSAVGDVMLNGVKAAANYSEKYAGGKTAGALELVGRFPKSEISRLTGMDFGFLTGDVPLGLNMGWDSGQNINVKADLTDNEIALPRYGYEKPKARELKLELALAGDKTAAQGHINLTGDVRAEGDLAFAAGYKLTAADIKNLSQGKTDMGLKYSQISANKYKIDIAGKTLDLAPVIADYGKAPDEKSESSYDISVNLKKILLADGESLADFSGQISCLPEYCAAGKFTARQGSGQFLYELNPDGEHDGKLIIHADDAGGLIKGLGISPHIVGGKLDLNSEISRNRNNSIDEGSLVMAGYSVMRAPVLAKIVSLASFNGILNILNGDGIKFKKMTLNFVKENDVLKIKESKAYGDSLGITAEGFADLRKSEINIAGTVVPAYALNSLLSGVPVIGDVLAGGEGQGVIAASYAVSGDYKNPAVSVNPLSLLTPGFLRGLFEMFDEKKQPPKAEDKNAAVP